MGGIKIKTFCVKILVLVLSADIACSAAEASSADRVSSPLTFETVKISGTDSLLPQGETEIVADNDGHVAVVWMMGSPRNLRQLTFRTASSSNGGKTFMPDREIAGDLRLADPSLALDNKGTIYLGALRKDSAGWSDVAVILFRSLDFGRSWESPVVISDDDAFYDRDWVDVDARSRVHVVFTHRVPRPGKMARYDRNAYYTFSSDGGRTFSPKIKVSDGGAVGVSAAPDGKIYVATQSAGQGCLFRGQIGQKAFEEPVKFTTKDVSIAVSGGPRSGQSPESHIESFPRQKAYTDHNNKTTVNVVWVGQQKNGDHGIYLARLLPGSAAFDAPRAIVTGPAGQFRLPALTVDQKGKVHVFWMQKVSSGNAWALFHAQSDAGQLSAPLQISPFDFPIEQWPGDFISATTNDTDLFVAWAAAGGPGKGVYVSRRPLLASSSVKSGETVAASQKHFGADYLWYGINQYNSQDNVPVAMRYVKDLNITSFRVDVHWYFLEPSRNKYNWEMSDLIVNSIPAGTDLIFTLYSNAPWATSGPSANQTSYSRVPDNLQDYYNFVSALARRYQGKVKYYQIENEVYGSPNTFWSGTKEGYLELLKTAFAAVKKADPKAQILVSGVALGHINLASVQNLSLEQREKYERGENFLNYVFQNGCDYFDITDIHLYYTLRSISERLNWFKSFLSQNKCDKPAWATEIGGLDPRAYKNTKDEALQAEDLVKRFTLAFGNGAERVFWLAIHKAKNHEHPVFGDMKLTHDALAQDKKPAYYALKLLIEKIGDFTSVTQISHGYKFIVRGKPVLVLWSDRAETIDISPYLSTSTATVTKIVTNLGPGKVPIDHPTAVYPSTAAPISNTPVFAQEEQSAAIVKDGSGSIDPRLPDNQEIFGWIKDLAGFGYRRPGTEAGLKAEHYIEQKFKGFGLEQVRLEPINVEVWHLENWGLTVEAGGERRLIPSFPAPFSHFTPPEGIEAQMVYVGEGSEADYARAQIKGKIAVVDIRFKPLFTDQSRSRADFVYDPDNTMPPGYTHPAVRAAGSSNLEGAYERAVASGAVGVVAILQDMPANKCTFYAPYPDPREAQQPLPMVYVGRDDGAALRRQLSAQTLNARLVNDGRIEPGVTHNVVGILPGREKGSILISSHHDSPFAGAVQDGSGISLVLALAKYFAQVPPEQRNKSLWFVATAGHFYGSVGIRTFARRHAQDLNPKLRAAIHLEHIAKEFVERDGELVDSGFPEPAFLFVSDGLPPLSTVKDAVVKNDLKRTFVMRVGKGSARRPSGESAVYFSAGVPVIGLASLPVYLLFEDDALDKVAVERLAPTATAMVEIIRKIDD